MKQLFKACTETVALKIGQFILGAGIAAALGAPPAMAEVGARNQSQGATFSACPSKAALLTGTAPSETATPCVAVVIFWPDVAPENRQDIVARSGARFRFGLRLINGVAVFVPNDSALAALLHDPEVQDIRPDGHAQILDPPSAGEPNTNARPGGSSNGGNSQVLPAGYLRIGANAVSTTGNGIGVAIVDTGVDLDHPDIAGNLAASCFTSYTSCDDDNGHGTHVAGIVAAENNTRDIVGIAPGAKIYPVKVLDGSGSGLFSDVLNGLQWVYDRNSSVPSTSPLPIQVVNMSLGAETVCGGADDPGLSVYTQKLADQGVVVVVAAGNNPAKEVYDMTPAGCPAVLAVASTTAQAGNNKCKVLAGRIEADTASSFTTDGRLDGGVGVTISAPGETREDNTCATIQSVGILSLAKGGGTVAKSGTSMAAPHVAGVVALMLQANGSLTPSGVKTIIRSSADAIGTAPLDHPYINETLDGEREGLVNAPKAVAGASK